MSQHLAKNTAFMTMASIGQKMIAFVYFLLLARVMMPERTGVFFLVTSIVTMFSVFTDLGLTSVVIREIAKRPEDKEKTVRRAIGLKLSLTAMAVVIVFVASILFHYSAQITEFIWITSVVMIFDALALLCYGILRGSQLLRYEAAGIMIGQSVTVLIGSISLLFFPDIRFLILALICGSFVNFLVASSQVIRLFGWNMLRPEWNNQAIWKLMKIMTPFALAGIFTKIYSSIDVVLISKLLSTTAVGIYSVAFKFTYAFQFLPLAFSAALYPSLSSTIEKDHTATAKTFSRAIWYILLVATPIVFGIWLVAPEMVRLTGHGYAESAAILRVLIFVLFPSFLEIPFGALLNASDRQTTRMKIMGIAMVTNTVLDVFLIPRLGLMGAVIGSLISYSLMVLIELVVVSKFLPDFLHLAFFKSVAGILASGLIMFVAGIMLKTQLHWIVVIPCVAFVYVLALYFTHSITKQDVMGLRSIFKKSPVV